MFNIYFTILPRNHGTNYLPKRNKSPFRNHSGFRISWQWTTSQPLKKRSTDNNRDESPKPDMKTSIPYDPCTSHSTKDKTIRTENKSMVIGLGMWTGDWLPKGHRKLQENNKKCSISLLFCWLHDCTYLSKLTFTRVNFAICKLCLTKPTYKRSDGICQAY